MPRRGPKPAAKVRLTSAEMSSISALAAQQIVDEWHKQRKTPSYKSLPYSKRSHLDSIAMRAMQQEEPHLNQERYLSVACGAVRRFLRDNPDFLQANTFKKPHVVTLI